MDQVTPKPLEDEVDSPKSSSSADSVDVNPLLDVSPPQEPETSGNDSEPESDENLSEIEDETSSHPNSNVSSIPNPSVGAGEPTEIPLLDNPVSEPISPAEAALEVIKNQDTHCLYCSICKSNITKDAVLFKKGEETYPYNTAPYVLWLPRLNLSWIRRFNLSWIRGFNLSWIRRFNPSWSPRNFKDFTPPSPRFLLAVVLAVVLLVLSINVMWFHHSPVTPLGPISPVTPPGPISPVTPLGPISPVTPPGPISPVTPPGPDSHVPPPPGPPPPVPPPGPDPYIIISWLIHFLSSKYLSIFSLLLLAILALLWPSISTSIDSLIKAAIGRCRGIENPIRPLCRNFINYLKALVTPALALVTPTRDLTPKSKPKTKTKTTPDEDTKTKTKTTPDQDPKTKTETTPDQDPKTKTKTIPEQDDDEDKDKDEDQTRKQNDDEDKDEDQTQKQNDDEDLTPPHDAIPIIKKIVEGLRTHIVDRLGNLDILKSIVYGGLIESITSLGVVSSAAASGASTLNVLALGVTSLFSGFILMCHSLRELVAKHKKAEEKAKQDPKQKKKRNSVPNTAGKLQKRHPPLRRCSGFLSRLRSDPSSLLRPLFQRNRQGTLQSCGCSRRISGLRHLTRLCQSLRFPNGKKNQDRVGVHRNGGYGICSFIHHQPNLQRYA